MPFDCFPFNSGSEADTGYGASALTNYWGLPWSDGVFIRDSADELTVIKAGGMDITIKDGDIFIQARNGHIYGGGVTMTAQTNETPWPRIDNIVMRLDYAYDAMELNRVGSLYPAIVQGEPGEGAPALRRDTEAWELCIARLTVPAGALSLDGATIADTRADRDLCGFSAWRGQPPYQPPTDVPAIVWDYTLYPETLTAEQRAMVENNPQLFAMYTQSRLVTQAARQHRTTRAPTAADDVTQGFQPGNTWTDTATGLYYTCVSNASGAAVWRPVSFAQESIEWFNLSLGAEWQTSAANTPRYTKVNGIVYILGWVTGGSDNSRLISTLPAGYRPKQSLTLPVSVSGGSFQVFYATIGTSGQISLLNYTASGQVLLNVSYPAEN